mgnify:CR=1 FL=1
MSSTNTTATAECDWTGSTLPDVVEGYFPFYHDRPGVSENRWMEMRMLRDNCSSRLWEAGRRYNEEARARALTAAERERLAALVDRDCDNEDDTKSLTPAERKDMDALEEQLRDHLASREERERERVAYNAAVQTIWRDQQRLKEMLAQWIADGGPVPSGMSRKPSGP